MDREGEVVRSHGPLPLQGPCPWPYCPSSSGLEGQAGEISRR